MMSTLLTYVCDLEPMLQKEQNNLLLPTGKWYTCVNSLTLVIDRTETSWLCSRHKDIVYSWQTVGRIFWLDIIWHVVFDFSFSPSPLSCLLKVMLQITEE